MASKGEQINTTATVTDRGAAVSGTMSWETPFIDFRLSDGRELRWWSNKAPAGRVQTGQVVRVQGYLRDLGGNDYRLYRGRLLSDGGEMIGA